MTADDSSRDDPIPDSDGDASDADAQPQTPLDEEAAWRLIVENYGERPVLSSDDDPVEPVGPSSATEPPRPAPPERSPFDRSYLDSLDAGRDEPAARHDRRQKDRTQPVDEPAEEPTDRHADEHFVPPEPPPVPRATPARRLAWCGLFLPPLLMLAAVVLDWVFPSWVSLGLVAAFIGGFVFLVATMPRDKGDGWGDGAVV
jgi:hypothetical protein